MCLDLGVCVSVCQVRTELYKAPDLPGPGHSRMRVSAVGEDCLIYLQTIHAGMTSSTSRHFTQVGPHLPPDTTRRYDLIYLQTLHAGITSSTSIFMIRTVTITGVTVNHDKNVVNKNYRFQFK